MKLFIWDHAEMGGGYSLVVLAENLEQALLVIKRDPAYGIDFSMPQKPPWVVEIDRPKVANYFEYYE